jgi:adenosylcobinamide-GDP ribazoletransferase
MKLFLIALQFLTILPVNSLRSFLTSKDKEMRISEEDFGKSLVFFPLVGGLIGLFLVLLSLIFSFLPHPVKISLVLIASIVISGAIHLDGFADTCDGLYGFSSKERALEIMQDSRIGAMGVIGIISLLILKYSLLLSLSQQNLWKLLILMTAFSRWAQVLACFLSDYARDEGKAKYFIEYAQRKEVLIGAVSVLILFLVLAKMKGALLFFVNLVPLWLFINFIKKKIAGMTGDTIGAISEVAEICLLLVGLIL